MLHDWRIEAREYLRHESRRGRRFAFERVEPRRTALVVVDMVPFFLEENPFARGIVANIQALASVLRRHGGTVVWVLPATREPSAVMTEFFGAAVAATYAASAGHGSLRGRLWHEFVVEDDDLVVEKSSASAFFPGRCDLHSRLSAREVDTVLVTGTVANVCCESTARDASTIGYRVIMVADANAAMRDEDLNATLHTIYRSFGDVRPTSDVLTLIESAVVADRP